MFVDVITRLGDRGEPRQYQAGQRLGRTERPASGPQLVIGQLVEQRADQQRATAGMVSQAPYGSLGELRSAKPQAQQAQLSGIESPERQHRRAAVAADEPGPSLAQL
jgi:hypothetical protein